MITTRSLRRRATYTLKQLAAKDARRLTPNHLRFRVLAPDVRLLGLVQHPPGDRVPHNDPTHLGCVEGSAPSIAPGGVSRERPFWPVLQKHPLSSTETDSTTRGSLINLLLFVLLGNITNRQTREDNEGSLIRPPSYITRCNRLVPRPALLASASAGT